MKTKAGFLVGLLLGTRVVACSPKSGDDGSGGRVTGTGSVGNTAGGPNGGASGSGTGSMPNFNTGGDGFPVFTTGGAGSGIKDAGCPAITQKPEEIITYKDATVTDTIITYSPIALYMMLDRSGSMVTGFPEGSKDSWNNSTNAINAFMTDPQSQNMDVGLAFFPTAPDNGWKCSDGTGSGSDCGAPVVEIAPAPRSGPQIATAMSGNVPPALNYTPTECGIIGMLTHCEDWTKKSGEQCVAILITDGNPTLCNAGQNQLIPTPPAQSDIDHLAQLVADAKTQGVITYALGLPGSNAATLDQIAAAGGTTKSIDVSGGVQAFVNALQSIRNKVSTTSTQHISIPTVIKSALQCEWKIPPPPQGQKFNPEKVNVKMTPENQPTKDLGYVAEADCARTDNAWYYDDPNNPTRVLVCPTTCDAIKATTAEVDLAFGCDRIKGIPK